MVFTRKKFFIIQILFLISSTIFLSGCTAQYQSPVSGPTANVDFITHPGVEKYTVYILEKQATERQNAINNDERLTYCRLIIRTI
ncbi:MAG: hypothetical protein HWD59_05880 [Coxiellaceae bacterium]|nr:MAG: hypothetical protein HWD59_05880 [Coxiellaceae bacterium]